MNFKAYPTKKTMPQRMTRKRMRRDIFIFNKKAAKLARKVRKITQLKQYEE